MLCYCHASDEDGFGLAMGVVEFVEESVWKGALSYVDDGVE